MALNTSGRMRLPPSPVTQLWALMTGFTPSLAYGSGVLSGGGIANASRSLGREDGVKAVGDDLLFARPHVDHHDVQLVPVTA